MALIKSNQIDRTSEAYIRANPVRASISAVGYGTVSAVQGTVEVIDLGRDIIKLAKLTLSESLIEAQRDAKIAELNMLDELAELEAQLASKRAKLIKA